MCNHGARIGRAALTQKGGNPQSTGSATNIALFVLQVRAQAALEAYKRALDASPSNSPDNLTLDTSDKGNKPTQNKD